MHFLGAGTQRRLLLHLAAELIGRIFPDLDFSSALGGDKLNEFLNAFADRVIRIVQMTPADRALLNVLTAGRSDSAASATAMTDARAKSIGPTDIDKLPDDGFSVLQADYLVQNFNQPILSFSDDIMDEA